MSTLSMTRRDTVKAAVAAAVGVTALGSGAMAAGADEAARGALFVPGTYTSDQRTGYAIVRVNATFDASSLTGLSYEVLETGANDYFALFGERAGAFCAAIVESGNPAGVDGIAGASLCTGAIVDGVYECMAQAAGVELPAERNPQQPYGANESGCSALFEPVQIGTMALKNRTYRTSGSAVWGADEGIEGSPALEAYGTMAENGVALISGTIRGVSLDDGITGEARAAYSEILDRVHAAGSYMAAQLSAGGVTSFKRAEEYTLEELSQIPQAMAAEALMYKELGYDCVEIKGATNDNLQAFASRRGNAREDEYGPQSFESRARMFCDCIRAVKETCGADFPVLVLMNGAENNDYDLNNNDLYLTVEEAQQIAIQLEAAGADFIQVRCGANGLEPACWAPDCSHFIYGANGANGVGGVYDYETSFGGALDGAHSGMGAFIPMAAAIKQVVSIPVGCAGGMDIRKAPDLINQAILDGKVDVVCINRPLNADQELVRKIQEGAFDEVRPCTHCFHCHDHIATNKVAPSRCRVNAAWQRAYTSEMPEGFALPSAEQSKRVLVIGAGPAGLEAARIAAERGHQVTLCESKGSCGGLLPFAQAVKGDHENLTDVAAYQEAMGRKLGVDVQYGTTADLDYVRSINPDEVVVAIGGARRREFESTDNVKVLGMDQALSRQYGKKVAVLGANVQAFDVALRLLAEGKDVAIVNDGPAERLDSEQSGWFQIYGKAHLRANGVRIWNNAQVNGIVEGGISIVDELGLEHVVVCDTVLEAYDMLPQSDLANEIAAAGYSVHCVGDCNEPKNIASAIGSANMVARAL